MIAIRVDTNCIIGMGHLGRCIAIADQIEVLGEEVLFIPSEMSSESTFESRGLKYEVVYSANICEWLNYNDINVLLVDSYSVSPNELENWNDFVPVVYIDDLHKDSYKISMIVNYNVEAKETFYPNRSLETRLLLGVKYFPARKEFSNIALRPLRDRICKVLVTTGSTDPKMICKSIASKLSKIEPNAFVYILKGCYFDEKYCEALEELSQNRTNIKTIEWGQNMAMLFYEMDLVISPGSTTVFESLSVGTPCISYSFVDSQIEQCVEMDKIGVCPYIGDISNEMFEMKLLDIYREITNIHSRQKIQDLSSELFDGNGAMRIAYAILTLKKGRC